MRNQILFDINLNINPGEFIIMTGPSGSGKTTLLTLIGGLRSVQEGSLQILGQELFGATNNQLVQIRRHIGFVFQSHNLLDFLTAVQNVKISLELHSEISTEIAFAKTKAMLERIGLAKQMHYYPHELSGGQKQRVAIARALVSHPKLILADEPTASLDSKTGREVVEIMQGLAKEQGCAIVLVTHDNRILDIADRLIHMEDGRLLDQGIPPGKTTPA